MTVRLKACARCGGDMSYESDMYGLFRQCLQCFLPGEPSLRGGSRGRQEA